ncbi:hypothetical protein ACIPWF_06075 [Paenarthrobacter sp. NPDC089989]|uniref:hypothetical protein n=1 Tax=unclassified Paenarthrobacter TaxID=2634190 RepID=UPI00382E76BD
MAAASYDHSLARQLYIWDRDVSAALLADIAIVEVAVRNAMAKQLEIAYGRFWYTADIGLDGPSRNKLAEAWSKLPQGRRTSGHLIAGLMFGFWKGLLEPGGYVGREPQRFRASHELLWNSCLNRAFRGGRSAATADGVKFTRTWTLGVVTIVHAARNRAAHHEPFVAGFPLPGQQHRLTVQQAHEACLKLARMLDRNLAGWLESTTRVPGILATRPG